MGTCMHYENVQTLTCEMLNDSHFSFHIEKATSRIVLQNGENIRPRHGSMCRRFDNYNNTRRNIDGRGKFNVIAG